MIWQRLNELQWILNQNIFIPVVEYLHTMKTCVFYHVHLCVGRYDCCLPINCTMSAVIIIVSSSSFTVGGISIRKTATINEQNKIDLMVEMRFSIWIRRKAISFRNHTSSSTFMLSKTILSWTECESAHQYTKCFCIVPNYDSMCWQCALRQV